MRLLREPGLLWYYFYTCAGTRRRWQAKSQAETGVRPYLRLRWKCTPSPQLRWKAHEAPP